jgi:predicted alpha/beta-fold hydrolase
MTMWGKFFRRRDLTRFRSERVEAPDGDELTLVTAGPDSGGPIVLLLHGLEGGVRSHYVGGIVDAVRACGWDPWFLVFRTCDGRMNRARRTYHSGETTDLDFVVRGLASRFPERAIALVGVSLGGNVLLKWLGENGSQLPPQMMAAAAVSTPYDLARSSRSINTGFSRVYQWNLLRSLRSKALLKREQHPGVVTAERLAAIRTMWEFDDVFTAPLHGFADARDYYERSSSIGFLARIARPTLLLSAYDDPFHPPDVLRDVERIAAGNPNLTVEFHERGGHVGFVSGSPWRPRYYIEQRVPEYLSRFLAQPANVAASA